MKRRKSKATLFIARAFGSLLLSVLLQTAGAQKKRVPDEVIPFDTVVRSGQLANGFTYFIRHNGEPKGRVLMYLAVKAGSVLEEEDQRGLAHFVEHMSFNGTKHFPKSALVDYLQKAGVRFGADLNAYTSFDETVYQLPLPADKPEVLQNGLQIMRDWAGEATFDSLEIEKERGVVLEEKRLRKSSLERMQDKYLPMTLNGSRYASRLPIGQEKVLQGFSAASIKKFYHDWYRPDLQALIVVGEIDVDSMEAAIKTKFSDLKNPVGEKLRTKYKIDLTGKNQFLALTDAENTLTDVELFIKHPAPVLTTTGGYRERIVDELMNQMLQDRFTEIKQGPNPPFVLGGAGIRPFLKEVKRYNLNLLPNPGPGEIERGWKAVWRENERARQFGFTATELKRAKETYMSRKGRIFKEGNKTPSVSFVNEYLSYFLRREASPGLQFEYALLQKNLPDISLAEVNRNLRNYITPGNRDILLMASDKLKDSLPDEATLLKWMAAVESEKLEPYKDVEITTPLLNSQPKPGSVVKEFKDTALGITTLVLSNGVKVVLKPTDFTNDLISFTSFAPGGTSLYHDSDYQSAAGARTFITSFGVGNYNTAQFYKYLSAKQMGVIPFINERIQGIGGRTTVKDFEAAMELTYAYFTAPRKDEVQFKNMIRNSIADLANRKDDPLYVFGDSVTAILNGYHLRKTGPTIEKMKQVNLNRLYEIYTDRFRDASGFTFVFVGNFGVQTIKPLLEKYLGSLPSIYRVEKANDLGIHVPEGRIEKNIYKGKEDKATVRLVFSGLFDATAANEMQLNALREALQIRLIERLREEESGVYSPNIRISNTKYPQGRYDITINFGCAPRNVDKLVASTLNEIEKLKTDGPPQVNVDKFKAEERSQWPLKLRSNQWWLSYLNDQLQNNEPLDEYLHNDVLLDQVTPASVKEAANNYFNMKNYIRLVLLPEKTAESF